MKGVNHALFLAVKEKRLLSSTADEKRKAAPIFFFTYFFLFFSAEEEEEDFFSNLCELVNNPLSTVQTLRAKASAVQIMSFVPFPSWHSLFGRMFWPL